MVMFSQAAPDQWIARVGKQVQLFDEEHCIPRSLPHFHCSSNRMEEESRRKQEAEEAAIARDKERKRLQKQGAGAKKLSFAMDVS